MISPVASSISITFPSILKVRSTDGRFYYPVKPLNSVAGIFKHIYTIPSEKGGGSLSLYKLRVLDSVIDRLMKYGKSAEIKKMIPARVTSENVDKLIRALSEKLNSVKSNYSLYHAGLEPDVGKIINLLA